MGVTGQVRPPNFSPDHLPDTDFTCEDKVRQRSIRTQIVHKTTQKGDNWKTFESISSKGEKANNVYNTILPYGEL